MPRLSRQCAHAHVDSLRCVLHTNRSMRTCMLHRQPVSMHAESLQDAGRVQSWDPSGTALYDSVALLTQLQVCALWQQAICEYRCVPNPRSC